MYEIQILNAKTPVATSVGKAVHLLLNFMHFAIALFPNMNEINIDWINSGNLSFNTITVMKKEKNVN